MAKSVHDIVNSPKFKSLVSTRWTVSFTLTFLLFVVYYGYILLVGYNKEFLAQKLAFIRITALSLVSWLLFLPGYSLLFMFFGPTSPMIRRLKN